MQYLGEFVFFSHTLVISEVFGKIPIHPNIACGGVQERQNKVVIFSQNHIFLQKYLVQQNFQISGSGLTCKTVKKKLHSQLVKF